MGALDAESSSHLEFVAQAMAEGRCSGISGSGADDLEFQMHLEALETLLQTREFKPEIHLPIFQRYHYASLLVLSHMQSVYDVAEGLLAMSHRFLSQTVNPICWLTKVLFHNNLKSLSVQLLEWLLYYCERISEALSTVSRMHGDYDRLLQHAERTIESIRMGLLRFVCLDLVNASATDQAAIRKSLNSYYHLIARESGPADIMATLNYVMEEHGISEGSLRQAQLYANLGTAFISHKPSFGIGRMHIKISQRCFEEALLLLPNDISSNERSHLRKNLKISRMVPVVLKFIAGKHAEDSSISKALRDSDAEDWSACIKFVLQMTNSKVSIQSMTQSVMQAVNDIGKAMEHSHSQMAQRCDEVTSAVLYYTV